MTITVVDIRRAHGPLHFYFSCAAKVVFDLKSSSLLDVDRGTTSSSICCQEVANAVVPLHNHSMRTGICVSAIPVTEQLATTVTLQPCRAGDTLFMFLAAGA